MARGESPRAVRATLAALEEAVENDDAGSHRYDKTDDANVADHISNDRNVVLREVQPVVFVAAWAENLPRLDHFGCQAVAMHRIVLAATGLDELWTDA